MPNTKKQKADELDDALYTLGNSLTKYFQAEAVSRVGAGREFLNNLDYARILIKNNKVALENPAVAKLVDAMKDICMEDLNNASVVARHLRDEAGFHPWNFE